VADYLQTLDDAYSKLYTSKQTDLESKKKKDLADLDTVEAGIKNTYKGVKDGLGTRKTDTQAKYSGLYTGLDNQLTEGKEGYYNDRNGAALDNSQRYQEIKDYMARNNLMSSGENVDAMLRANTNYNNILGNIYSSEKKFEKGIGDTRNQYNLDEQNAYNDIDNQLSASESEEATKLADIMTKRGQLDTDMNSELLSYKDSLDAQKLIDINEYNERLRQEAVAKEMAAAEAKAAAARSSSSGGSRSSSSSSAQDKKQKEADTNATWAELYNQIDDRSGEAFLRQNRDNIIQNLGSAEYNKMLDYVKNYQYSATENQVYGRNQKNRTPDTYMSDYTY
jgi:hypothetical protein